MLSGRQVAPVELPEIPPHAGFARARKKCQERMALPEGHCCENGGIRPVPNDPAFLFSQFGKCHSCQHNQEKSHFPPGKTSDVPKPRQHEFQKDPAADLEAGSVGLTATNVVLSLRSVLDLTS